VYNESFQAHRWQVEVYRAIVAISDKNDLSSDFKSTGSMKGMCGDYIHMTHMDGNY
jgi:hypothetical protein